MRWMDLDMERHDIARCVRGGRLSSSASCPAHFSPTRIPTYHSCMSDPHAERVIAELRGNTTAEMRFEEHLRPIRYVITREGRLAMPAMLAMLKCFDTVLFVPQCYELATEVQVTLEQFEEKGEAGAIADRWRIYHGEPDDLYWATASVDCVRCDAVVVDGEAIDLSNPLAEHEARICKHMNEDHQDDLRLLCKHFGGTEIEQPRMVGVDPRGIDIRARFDVYRVPSKEMMDSPERVREVLTAMTHDAREREGGQSE